jgi:hypothetical protein
MIEKPGRISRFVEEGVGDDDLPLVKRTRRKPGKPFTLVRDDAEHRKLKCFKAWKFDTIQRFEEKQWTVVVPCFSQHASPIELVSFSKNTIIPLISCKQLSQSGCADVFEVKIHPAQHKLCDEEEVCYTLAPIEIKY